MNSSDSNHSSNGWTSSNNEAASTLVLTTVVKVSALAATVAAVAAEAGAAGSRNNRSSNDAGSSEIKTGLPTKGFAWDFPVGLQLGVFYLLYQFNSKFPNPPSSQNQNNIQPQKNHKYLNYQQNMIEKLAKKHD